MVPRQCGADAYYATNYAEAKALGIRVGPYHRAFVGGNGPVAVKADARAEARLFSATVGELGGTDLRPALDMETPFADLSPFELRLWARTWLRSVERRLGARPIIYTNVSSWNALGNPTWFAQRGYPLWVANWDVAVPAVPALNWAGFELADLAALDRAARSTASRAASTSTGCASAGTASASPADASATPAACSPA